MPRDRASASLHGPRCAALALRRLGERCGLTVRSALGCLFAVGLLAQAIPAAADPGGTPNPPAAAAADQPDLQTVEVRTGDHSGFGRIVYNLPPGASAQAFQEDGLVVVRLTGGKLPPLRRIPRNVESIGIRALPGQGSEARLVLAPRTTWTATQSHQQLVIEVHDAGPAPPRGAVPAAAAATTAAPATPPNSPPPAASPAAPSTAAVPPLPAPAAMVAAADATPKVAPLMPAAAVKPTNPPQRADAAGVPSQPARRFSGPAPRPWPHAAAEPPPMAAAQPPTHAEPASAPAQPPPRPTESAPAATATAPTMPEPTAAAAGAAPEAAPKMSAVPVQPVESAPAPPPSSAVPSTPAAAPAAAGEHGDAGPVALVGHAAGEALALPFAATTGAAAFRRGDEWVVVFDERRPLDLGELPDGSPFASARVQLLPAATILRLDADAETVLGLQHTRTGWTLTRVPLAKAPLPQPIRVDFVDGHVRLAAAAPASVVTLPDPETEALLIVGTVGEPGQGVPVARRTPDFTLLETLQGVALEPQSDALVLRALRGGAHPGFALEAEGGRSIALDPPDPQGLAAVAAAHMTRRWDFPPLSTQSLWRRLQAATLAAAAVPLQARAAPRMQAVQAQLALGLGVEAQALANLTATDDFRFGEAADAAALSAVAALLAGRPDQASALDDPRLGGSDELTLWRAAYHAMRREGSAEAAEGFAATVPLLLAYPAGLRAHLMPLAAETMALGGEPEAARRLLASQPDDRRLDYARGLLAERDGKVADALSMFDRVALSNDRRDRARAAVRAVELRLHEGMLTAEQAATALDKLVYAWRGDAQELGLRLRVAELQSQVGNARGALAMLRETADTDFGKAFEDQRPAIRQRLIEVFSAAMAEDQQHPLPPVELVSLIDENPDLLPDDEGGRKLAARVADRLAQLDLPKRVVPALQRLMDATPEGPARAEIGARLAALRLDQGDPAAALGALSASAVSDLPAALNEARTITFARATAARGDVEAATAALAALDSAAADEARATLLETAKNWPGAVAALSSYAKRTVPADGALNDAAVRTLLRLASAAAQAGDEALLGRLRDENLLRMPPGKLGDMFRVLTESPVQGVADLPRAAQEATLARGLPAALQSLQPAAPTVR